MILGYISLLGIKIYNYAIFIIVLCLVVKIIKEFFNKISKKQADEKKIRDQKIKEFQKETNGDRDALTDKIYNFYQESNYNPFFDYFIKVVIFVLDFAIISAMVATFKPISNFNIVSDESAASIVSIYKEREGDAAKKYVEIRLLKDLDEYVDEYKANGVSDEEIQTLYDLKETFMIGNTETYIVPSMDKITVASALPIMAFFIFVLNTILSMSRQFKSIKKAIKTGTLQQKMLALLSPAMTLLSVVLICTFIFNTPMIISFYFIINYTWNFIRNIILLYKDKTNNAQHFINK